MAACGTFRLTWEEEGRLDNVNPLTQEILERLEASRGRGTGGSRHSVLINFVCRLDRAKGCPESWQALFLGVSVRKRAFEPVAGTTQVPSPMRGHLPSSALLPFVLPSVRVPGS